MNIKLSDILKTEDFRLIAGEDAGNEITGIYICDLLSWVMGRAQEKSAWITIMGHINIVAVAALTGVSCIIVAENAEIDEATIQKANSEDIPLLSTMLTAFDAAQKLVELSKMSE